MIHHLHPVQQILCLEAQNVEPVDSAPVVHLQLHAIGFFAVRKNRGLEVQDALISGQVVRIFLGKGMSQFQLDTVDLGSLSFQVGFGLLDCSLVTVEKLCVSIMKERDVRLCNPVSRSNSQRSDTYVSGNLA